MRPELAEIDSAEYPNEAKNGGRVDRDQPEKLVPHPVQNVFTV